MKVKTSILLICEKALKGFETSRWRHTRKIWHIKMNFFSFFLLLSFSPWCGETILENIELSFIRMNKKRAKSRENKKARDAME